MNLLKNMSTLSKSLLGAILAIICYLAFAGHRGPSESEATESMKTWVAANHVGYIGLTGDQMSETCGVIDNRLVRFDKAEVVTRGDAHDGYYPVKVKVSGVCAAQLLRCGAHNFTPCDPVNNPFTTNPITVVFRKDDFGSWSVNHVEKG